VPARLCIVTDTDISFGRFHRPDFRSMTVSQDCRFTSDGRNRRSQKSRQRLIDAMIALVTEGQREPTAEQIAERAGLAMRTVFRHFDDMDNLYREIARRMQDQARDLFDAPVDGATWQETLHNTVDKWVRLYEKMMPMRQSSDALRHRSEFLQQDHARFVRMGRQRLKDLLPASIVDDRFRFEALDAMIGYEVWIRLRQDQRLSVDAARRTLHAAVDRLVAEP
jgi:AcrR family transcriptional regulator